jgi:hypothetical protein
MQETGGTKANKLEMFRGIIQDMRNRKVPTIDIRPAGKDTLAYLVFSTGKSGLPKGIIYVFFVYGKCSRFLFCNFWLC